MSIMLSLFFSILVSSSFFSAARSALSYPGDVNQWCEQTPYSKTCKHFMNQGSYNNSAPKHKGDFRKLSIQVALGKALDAYGITKKLGPKCRNEREKAAWADCVTLYKSTILQLKKTLDSRTKSTDFDAQTWISTALTNLDTCENGFIELGVSDYIWPLMANNVSELICNILSLGNSSNLKTAYKYNFPTWVSPKDRKLLQYGTVTPNLVVDQDGSGNYTTIQAAINAASSGSGRFVIHVKQGVYKENVIIKKKNIMLVGDGLNNTIITGNRSVVGGSTTFNSSTVAVTGDGFIARDITFRNTAGPQNQQAVALRSGADHSVFYGCSIEGYQDTLYVYSQRQFYRECNIYGTVDFIFGNAIVVLQNCVINARKPISGQQNTITAQGRTDPNQNTGISILNSRVQASPDLSSMVGSVKSYLGRPWKQYSRTIFLETYLDSLIDPAGWLAWDGTFALDTLFYAEYQNTGPGSSTGGRVKWKGYKNITSLAEAATFNVHNFIDGNSWLQATDVPFSMGI